MFVDVRDVTDGVSQYIGTVLIRDLQCSRVVEVCLQHGGSAYSTSQAGPADDVTVGLAFCDIQHCHLQ